MPVRTRFPPSPTGHLHIGSARTALFNFLYARHHGGQFVFRIEDTDKERSTPESIAGIVDGMTWLGLTWDEGPFFQSERTALYQAWAEKLLTAGRAYRCWCTTAELEAKREAATTAGRRQGYDRTCRDLVTAPTGRREFVIRYRGPIDGETVVDDAVKGRVVFQNAELDDLVILRTDGTPVYNFCVVVDDADMRITDVIRGDDHLANTPKQVLLYQALDVPLPRFAHIPLILGTDKTRLSKRHGATAVTAYREMGYLPDAVVNYLARLGWSHGDQELFTRAELIEHFSLDTVGSSSAVFNPEKLLWVNFQHLKGLTPEELATCVVPFLEQAGLPVPADRAWLARAVETLRERAKTLVELAELCRFYIVESVSLDDAVIAKHLPPSIVPVIEDLAARLAALDGWDHGSIESAFQATLTAHDMKLGKLAQPVRVAVTGGTVSPGIYEVLDVLGRDRSLARLRAAIVRSTAACTASS